MELLKGFHVGCLGENDINHVLSGTVADFEYVPHDRLLYKVATNVNVFCMGVKLIVLSLLKTGFQGCSEFGFGSYGTWLQLMCCAGLVVST